MLASFLHTAPTQAGGVTIITHGLNGNVDDWVTAMAEQIPAHFRFPGTNSTCYKLYFIPNGSTYQLAWMRVRGGQPAVTDSGEILILLDWSDLAGGFDYDTYQVASMVASNFLRTNFISELGGHSLAELPMHLIGHSRGGSLMCQISQLLGTNGVWVDHLTTLDPHPLNNDGFGDFPFTATDAPCHTYQNVLFHDNYYQELNVIAYGEPVAGAYVRELISLDGGYGGLTASHSDVHLWYHGTIDFRKPASDYAAFITDTELNTWWTPYENYGLAAGFYYSLIGHGDRLSTNRPAGPGTSRISDGVNQLWDFGAGIFNNRTLLPANNGNWPNVMKLNLTGTNVVAFGQSNTVNLYYQWGRPAASNATIGLYLDDDYNPYNGNERLLRQWTAAGTGTAQVDSGSFGFSIEATNATPGRHPLYARITGGGRTRYLYAPERLTVFSSFEPPRLDIARNGSGARVEVLGIPGQRFVFQSSANLRAWQSLSTNWLSTNSWSYTANPAGPRFYRAFLQ